MKDPLARFRKMLDQKNWPMTSNDWVIVEGEIYEYYDEWHCRKPLFKKFRDYDRRTQ